MKFEISEAVTRTYVVDAEDLKDRFPEEWEVFKENAWAVGDIPTDQAWVIDCFEANPDLFPLVSEKQQDWYISEV